MATPRMVAPLLEEEMLEFELLLRKGLDHDELLRIFRKLRKRTERRNGALKASADLHRYGYVTPLTLREYPWLAGTLTVPPHEEDNDEAA